MTPKPRSSRPSRPAPIPLATFVDRLAILAENLRQQGVREVVSYDLDLTVLIRDRIQVHWWAPDHDPGLPMELADGTFVRPELWEPQEYPETELTAEQEAILAEFGARLPRRPPDLRVIDGGVVE